MNDRVVSFPWMGRGNTFLLKKTLEVLGLKVLLPPPISERTVKLGVRHSADMMCFPYKVTLGSFVEALDRGANTLLMYDNCGRCRQRHYWKIHEFTLRKLGYDFELYPVSRHTMLPVLRKLSGRSTLAVFRAYRRFAREIGDLDRKRYPWSSAKLNIGLIGEIYTCCEERVNCDIERKLKKLGVNPFNTSVLSDFMKADVNVNPLSMLRGFFRNSDEIVDDVSVGPDKLGHVEEARQYLNGPVGGHGFENVYNLLWLRDRGVDGVMHLLPLTCMPETTVEPIINHICQEAGIPLLRLVLDETNSEANIDTRVETFIELIKRKRKAHEVLARN